MYPCVRVADDARKAPRFLGNTAYASEVQAVSKKFPYPEKARRAEFVSKMAGLGAVDIGSFADQYMEGLKREVEEKRTAALSSVVLKAHSSKERTHMEVVRPRYIPLHVVIITIPQAHISIHIHFHIHTMHARTYAYIVTHTCTSTSRTRTHAHACARAYARAYAHAHTHTHTQHARTRTRTHTT